MNENRNMTKSEAALARAEKALAEAREASARTDQAIDRAQEAINKFWERQEAALARMRGEEKAEQAEEKDAKTEQGEPVGALREAPLQYRIDPNMLVELVSDLLLLAGRMNERLQEIERSTKPKRKRRRSQQKWGLDQF